MILHKWEVYKSLLDAAVLNVLMREPVISNAYQIHLKSLVINPKFDDESINLIKSEQIYGSLLLSHFSLDDMCFVGLSDSSENFSRKNLTGAISDNGDSELKFCFRNEAITNRWANIELISEDVDGKTALKGLEVYDSFIAIANKYLEDLAERNCSVDFFKKVNSEYQSLLSIAEKIAISQRSIVIEHLKVLDSATDTSTDQYKGQFERLLTLISDFRITSVKFIHSDLSTVGLPSHTSVFLESSDEQGERCYEIQYPDVNTGKLAIFETIGKWKLFKSEVSVAPDYLEKNGINIFKSFSLYLSNACFKPYPDFGAHQLILLTDFSDSVLGSFKSGDSAFHQKGSSSSYPLFVSEREPYLESICTHDSTLRTEQINFAYKQIVKSSVDDFPEQVVSFLDETDITKNSHWLSTMRFSKPLLIDRLSNLVAGRLSSELLNAQDIFDDGMNDYLEPSPVSSNNLSI